MSIVPPSFSDENRIFRLMMSLDFCILLCCSVFWSLLADRDDRATLEGDWSLRITNWLWGLSGLLLFLFWSSLPRVASFITWTITYTLYYINLLYLCEPHTLYILYLCEPYKIFHRHTWRMNTYTRVCAHIHTKIYTCGHLFNYLPILVIILRESVD